VDYLSESSHELADSPDELTESPDHLSESSHELADNPDELTESLDHLREYSHERQKNIVLQFHNNAHHKHCFFCIDDTYACTL